jgi:cytosine/adenosine deaminase-related metal-dependent hydrolase
MMIIAEQVMIRADREPIVHGAVIVQEGRILAAGPAARVMKRYPGHRRIECKKSVLLPGLVNVHTHLELPPLHRTVRTKDYTGWVLALLRERAVLTRADHMRAATRNIGLLLRTGTTTVGEICSYDASPAAIRRSGIRATIYHEIISLRPDDRLPALVPRSFRATRLVRQGLSPHSPHTTSEAVIAFLRRVKKERGIPLCMHVAETRGEGDLLRRSPSTLDRIYAAAGWDRDWAPCGRTSFEYLARMGILDQRFLAVHAVHVDTRDLSLIRKTGTAVAHCPRSNHALRIGTLPLKRFLDAGITVGLGTDSLASVATLSLWDEMRFALRTHRRTGVTARQVLELATRGGAKALGLAGEIGTLEPGKQADLIAVPMPRRSTGDPCSDLLRETKSCTMTMVNGKVLYRADDPPG